MTTFQFKKLLNPDLFVISDSLKLMSCYSETFYYFGIETVARRCSACNFIKKSLWHRRFPVNFVKFLRTPFFYRTPLVAASVGSVFPHRNQKEISYFVNRNPVYQLPQVLLKDLKLKYLS